MIDPATQLAALIRAQFAAQVRAQEKLGEGGAASNRAAQRKEPGLHKAQGELADMASNKAENARLQQLVLLRARALSPTDPERERKAFRLFLESVLIQSFGRDRMGEAGFDQMVDAVLQRMESDVGLRSAMKQAASLLLTEAQPSGARSV